jgi:hypothetical protein
MCIINNKEFMTGYQAVVILPWLYGHVDKHIGLTDVKG